MCTPEVDIWLLETRCTEFVQERLLFGTAIRSRSLVLAAHDFHSGSEAPVCQVDVLARLKKIETHGQHDTAPVNEIVDARIMVFGSITLGPPIFFRLLTRNWHVFPPNQWGQ